MIIAGRLGFWSITDRLAEISAPGDPLETRAATVDFERVRPVWEKSPGRPPGWKGGRPAFDPVLKVRMLVLQSLHGLSLEQTGCLVRDRLSWMRFCQRGPEDRVPDAKTLWDFHDALIEAGALDALFARLDRAIMAAGHLPRGGQIPDAALVAAPRQSARGADRPTQQVTLGLGRQRLSLDRERSRADGSIARRRAGARCRKGRTGPTPRRRRCALRSSLSSPSRRPA